jgi:integrase
VSQLVRNFYLTFNTSAPTPYRLLFTILRETGMRAGEVLDLRWGDVILDAWREALRVREAKNGLKRTVVLGPTATPRTVRGSGAARRALGHLAAGHDVLFISNRGMRVSYVPRTTSGRSSAE